MKKNDLIELLQGIKGNPEIKLWNGYVQDYQDIDSSIEKIRLIKHSFNDYMNCVRMSGYAYTQQVRELSENDLAQSRKDYNKQSYEINEFVTKQDIEEGHYKAKNVYLLQPKPRGKTDIGWMGAIDY